MTVLAFAAIGVRLFDLQARDRTHLASLGLGQRVRTVTIPAERGNIFDRNGTMLAVSVPQTTIVADPRVIKDPLVYAAKLAPIVHVDQAELEARLSDHKSAFAYVARKVDDATAKQVRDLDLVGISFQDESKRFYPSGRSRRPVVGFVGTDNTGLGGMEYHYDTLLTGTPGSVQVERDPQGNDIPGGERQVSAAKRGQDVVLTHRLVAAVEDRAGAAAGRHVDERQGRHRGGRRRADRRRARDGDRRRCHRHRTRARRRATESNRPVTDVYEPGSTNKVITMAGAIQEGRGRPRHRVRRSPTHQRRRQAATTTTKTTRPTT